MSNLEELRNPSEERGGKITRREFASNEAVGFIITLAARQGTNTFSVDYCKGQRAILTSTLRLMVPLTSSDRDLNGVRSGRQNRYNL